MIALRSTGRAAPVLPLLLSALLNACGAHFVQNLDDAPPTDFRRVEWFAQMANLAYQPDSLVRAAYPGMEVQILDLPQVEGRVFVATDHARKTHYVSSRGTANLADALLDAEYSKRLDRKVDVELHRGFEKSAIAAYGAVAPLLKPGYRVNLTGHSLGGAMAVILMMYLGADGHPIGEVVTFGQPKVTNHRGAERFASSPVLRIVDCRDPVPLVPPLALLSAIHGPYRHFGREVILLAAPHYVFLEEHDAERSAVSSFWESLPNVVLSDHHMASYVARIRGHLDDAERVQYDDRGKYPCPALAPAAVR